MHQIAGSTSPFNLDARRSRPRFAGFLVFLFAVAGMYGAYRVYRVGQPTRAPTTTPVAAMVTSEPSPSRDDWARHVDEALATQAHAERQLVQCEARLRRSLRDVTNTNDSKQLQTAISLVASANEDLTRAREELSFVYSNLKGEKEK